MSSTTNQTHITQQTLDFRQKYKTQKCRYWYERGYCPFNQSCAFAHHQDELRDKHVLNQHYKTKVCINFKKYGYCKYGDRCQFLHLSEAPTTYARPTEPLSFYQHSYSEKYSETTDEFLQEKHRKKLNQLSNFGLELFSLKKANRQDRWRMFVQLGVVPKEPQNQWESHQWREKDFEAAFPDYDFSRKPRLGSF